MKVYKIGKSLNSGLTFYPYFQQETLSILMVNTHQLGMEMIWLIFFRTQFDVQWKKTRKQGLTKRSGVSSQYFFLCGFITLLGIQVQGCLLHSVLSLYNLTHSEPFSAFSFANYKSTDISLSFICLSSKHLPKVRVISDPPCAHNEPFLEYEVFEGQCEVQS